MEMRFTQLTEKYLAWADKTRHPSTVYAYALYFRKWVAYFGDQVVKEITPADVVEFARSWHECQAIKRLFKWATEEACLFERNPIKGVKPPRRGFRRRVLTRKEEKKILRWVKRDLRLLLIAFRETAARPQELRNVTWENVHPERPGDTIDQALRNGLCSIVLYDFKDCSRRRDDERPRVILLSPRACRLLLRLRKKKQRKKDPVFVTERGNAWTPDALRCRFRRMRKKLKIKRDERGETIVPYTFRHTAATRAAAAGVRDRVLADVLGHVETKTTARYQHLCLEDLRTAMLRAWQAR
jgi:integrase